MLARTDDVAVAVIDAVAFSIGLNFTVAVLRRTPRDSHRPEYPFGRFAHARGTREPPPDLLRFGVEFSDGRKATTLGVPMFMTAQEEAEPEGPFLMPGGGSGGDDYWESSFWLWPLPPPGPLVFVVEWPLRRFADTARGRGGDHLEAARTPKYSGPTPPAAAAGLGWTDS